MITLCLLLSGMGTFCFIAVMNVFGLAVEGFQWSILLSSYTIIFAMVSAALFIMKVGSYRFSLSSMAYCGAIVIICLGFMITSQYARDASRYFFLFVSTAVPGFMAGLQMCDHKLLRHAWKYIDVFMVLFTASLAVYQLSADQPFGYTVDYQTASYMGAFSFGLNLCMLSRADGTERFRLFNSHGWRICSIALLGLQAILTFMTGGRGGVALLLLFALAAFAILMKQGIGIKKFVVLGLAAALMVFVFHFVMENRSLNGVARIFSGRDNRTNVYDLAFCAFRNKPFLGYGPYGYLDALNGIGYPHNIILELLLTYGIAGIIVEVGLAIVLCVHIKRTGLSNIPSWVFVIGIYSVVRLFFSSTFLSFSPFWFVLGFLCNYSSVSCEMGSGETARRNMSKVKHSFEGSL